MDRLIALSEPFNSSRGGGGYLMYANIANYTALYTNVMAKPGSDMSVLLLSYDQHPHLFFSRGIIVAVSSSLHTRSLTKLPPINRHCPLAPYPRPLHQAVLILQHLLITRSASTILIGGNLTATFLSHLSHPHSDSSISKATLLESLLGTVLIIL